MENYFTSECAAVSGASLLQLQWWDEAGIVAITCRRSGKGTPRLYSATQVFECKLIVAMRKRKVGLKGIRKALAVIRSYPASRFIVIGRKIAAYDNLLDAVTAQLGPIWVIDLEPIRKAVQRQLKDLG